MQQGVAYQPVCPVHFGETSRCDWTCRRERQQFQQASDALRKYWPVWQRRMQARYGRWFAGERAA
jgi:hypothetical protein